MKLTINNFAKIKKADISIDSITVIAGLNNTAKTTIGKLLFCIVDSLKYLDIKIVIERENRILHSLDKNLILENSFFDYYYQNYFRNICKDIVASEVDETDIKALKELIQELILKHDIKNAISYLKEGIDSIAKDVAEVCGIDRNEIAKIILNENLNAEFHKQLNNVSEKNKNAIVNLEIDKQVASIDIKNNQVIKMSDFKLDNSVIMIDNPFILDRRGYDDEKNTHYNDLYRKIFFYNDDAVANAFDEIIGTKKLEKVMKKLETIIQGNLTNYNGEDVYQESSDIPPIHITNLSTGLKAFVILKKLILNNQLNEKSILILDEPEIHLHPEWQLVYAELIVLLQKELNIKVLVTTHSPYFIEALEVFVAMHKVKKSRFYLSEMSNNSVIFKDTTKNMESVYSLLAKPFQTLENLKYKGVEND